MQYSPNITRNSIQPISANTNDLVLQRLRYQVYQCNYLLSAQREQLEGYRELIEDHSSTKDTLREAQNEVANLRNQLVQVRIDHQKEICLLSRKMKLVTNNPDEVVFDSLTYQPPMECSGPPLTRENVSTSINNEEFKYNNFMAEFLNVKLELAKAHSDADWKELRWNRLKVEHAVLLDIVHRVWKVDQQPEINHISQQRRDRVFLPSATRNKDKRKLGITPSDEQTIRSNHSAPQGMIRSISMRLLCNPERIPAATQNSDDTRKPLVNPLEDNQTIRSNHSNPQEGMIRSMSKRLLCIREQMQIAPFISVRSF